MRFEPQAEAVVFAPGSFLNHGQFLYLAKTVRTKGLNPILPDYPGVGISGDLDPYASGVGSDQVAEDLLKVAQHLDVERFHLVGESLGALIAIAIAAKHPDRIATITLSGMPLPLGPGVHSITDRFRERSQRMADWLDNPARVGARLSRAVTTRMGYDGPVDQRLRSRVWRQVLAAELLRGTQLRTLARLMQHYADPERLQRDGAQACEHLQALARNGVPTLFIGGTEDNLAKPEMVKQARAVHGASRTSTIHWIEGANHGHWLKSRYVASRWATAFEQHLRRHIVQLPRRGLRTSVR